MTYEWDEAKRQVNLSTHGLDFLAVVDFDWDSAIVMQDPRQDYQEGRYIALGFLGERLTVLVFTWRDTVIRVISFRKANKCEVKLYETRGQD